MTVCAVIGNGPRTGTTFVMRRLHEAGLPVVWDQSLNIPGAGYDILPNDVFHVEHGIVKAFPQLLRSVYFQRIVVLRRNRAEQLRSAYEQRERERDAGALLAPDVEPEYVLDTMNRVLGKWLLAHRHSGVLEVRTEELDVRIDEIIDWMAAPYQRRVA